MLKKSIIIIILNFFILNNCFYANALLLEDKETVDSSVSLTTPLLHQYNYIPDQDLENPSSFVFLHTLRFPHDDSDLLRAEGVKALPIAIDLRSQFPEVIDQGNLGCCVPATLTSIAQFYMQEISHRSPLMLYWYGRFYRNSIFEDCGISFADGIRALYEKGVCDESLWPYDQKNLTLKPGRDCEEDALHCRILNPQKVIRISNSIDVFKKILSQKYPIAVGMVIHDIFESEAVKCSGIIPKAAADDKFLGRHAVTFVGYDDEKEVFILRNSWGKKWGNNGYGMYPYARISSDVIDAWVIMGVGDSTSLPCIKSESTISSLVPPIPRKRAESYSKLRRHASLPTVSTFIDAGNDSQ